MTIMLNFVVLAFLNWIVATRLHVPETLHTPEIHAGSIPRLDEFIPAFHGSAANLTVLWRFSRRWPSVLSLFATWL